MSIQSHLQLFDFFCVRGRKEGPSHLGLSRHRSTTWSMSALRASEDAAW